MKLPLLVVLLALSATLALVLVPFRTHAALPNEVEAPVTVGWEIRPGGPADALVPSGQPLQKHPGYADFQQSVIDEILGQCPSEIRNAWPFQRVVTDPEGHLEESEVVAFLEARVDELNDSRAAAAAAEGLPDPPEFSLSTGVPESIEYVFWNATKKCRHRYALDLGGVPWELTDASVPATARFTISMAWDNRIESSQ